MQEFARLDGEIKTLNVAAGKKDFAEARIDLAAIEDLDTAGAWLLHDLRKQFETARRQGTRPARISSAACSASPPSTAASTRR